MNVDCSVFDSTWNKSLFLFMETVMVYVFDTYFLGMCYVILLILALWAVATYPNFLQCDTINNNIIPPNFALVNSVNPLFFLLSNKHQNTLFKPWKYDQKE